MCVLKSPHGLGKLKTTLVDAHHHYRGIKPSKKGIVAREHLKCFKELRSNKEVILSRTDEGAGTVILNKKDNIEKMKSLIGDLSKFTLNAVKKDKMMQVE